MAAMSNRGMTTMRRSAGSGRLDAGFSGPSDLAPLALAPMALPEREPHDGSARDRSQRRLGLEVAEREPRDRSASHARRVGDTAESHPLVSPSPSAAPTPRSPSSVGGTGAIVSALSRYEARMGTLTLRQDSLDCRLAELRGFLETLAEDQAEQSHRAHEPWVRLETLEEVQRSLGVDLKVIAAMAEESHDRQIERLHELEQRINRSSPATTSTLLEQRHGSPMPSSRQLADSEKSLAALESRMDSLQLWLAALGERIESPPQYASQMLLGIDSGSSAKEQLGYLGAVEERVDAQSQALEAIAAELHDLHAPSAASSQKSLVDLEEVVNSKLELQQNALLQTLKAESAAEKLVLHEGLEGMSNTKALHLDYEERLASQEKQLSILEAQVEALPNWESFGRRLEGLPTWEALQGRLAALPTWDALQARFESRPTWDALSAWRQETASPALEAAAESMRKAENTCALTGERARAAADQAEFQGATVVAIRDRLEVQEKQVLEIRDCLEAQEKQFKDDVNMFSTEFAERKDLVTIEAASRELDRKVENLNLLLTSRNESSTSLEVANKELGRKLDDMRSRVESSPTWEALDAWRERTTNTVAAAAERMVNTEATCARIDARHGEAVARIDLQERHAELIRTQLEDQLGQQVRTLEHVKQEVQSFNRDEERVKQEMQISMRSEGVNAQELSALASSHRAGLTRISTLEEQLGQQLRTLEHVKQEVQSCTREEDRVKQEMQICMRSEGVNAQELSALASSHRDGVIRISTLEERSKAADVVGNQLDAIRTEFKARSSKDEHIAALQYRLESLPTWDGLRAELEQRLGSKPSLGDLEEHLATLPARVDVLYEEIKACKAASQQISDTETASIAAGSRAEKALSNLEAVELASSEAGSIAAEGLSCAESQEKRLKQMNTKFELQQQEVSQALHALRGQIDAQRQRQQAIQQLSNEETQAACAAAAERASEVATPRLGAQDMKLDTLKLQIQALPTWTSLQEWKEESVTPQLEFLARQVSEAKAACGVAGTRASEAAARCDAQDKRLAAYTTSLADAQDKRLVAIENDFDAAGARAREATARVDAQERRLAAIETEFDVAGARVREASTRADAQEKRLVVIENDFDAAGARAREATTRVDAHERRLAAIETEFDVSGARVREASSRADAQEKRLAGIETKFDDVSAKACEMVSRAEEQDKRLTAMETEFNVTGMCTREITARADAQEKRLTALQNETDIAATRSREITARADGQERRLATVETELGVARQSLRTINEVSICADGQDRRSVKSLPTWDDLHSKLENVPTWDSLQRRLDAMPTWDALQSRLEARPTWDALQGHLETLPTWEALRERLESRPTWDALKAWRDDAPTQQIESIAQHVQKVEVAHAALEGQVSDQQQRLSVLERQVEGFFVRDETVSKGLGTSITSAVAVEGVPGTGAARAQPLNVQCHADEEINDQIEKVKAECAAVIEGMESQMAVKLDLFKTQVSKEKLQTASREVPELQELHSLHSQLAAKVDLLKAQNVDAQMRGGQVEALRLDFESLAARLESTAKQNGANWSRAADEASKAERRVDDSLARADAQQAQLDALHLHFEDKQRELGQVQAQMKVDFERQQKQLVEKLTRGLEQVRSEIPKKPAKPETDTGFNQTSIHPGVAQSQKFTPPKRRPSDTAPRLLGEPLPGRTPENTFDDVVAAAPTTSIDSEIDVLAKTSVAKYIKSFDLQSSVESALKTHALDSKIEAAVKSALLAQGLEARLRDLEEQQRETFEVSLGCQDQQMLKDETGPAPHSDWLGRLAAQMRTIEDLDWVVQNELKIAREQMSQGTAAVSEHDSAAMSALLEQVSSQGESLEELSMLVSRLIQNLEHHPAMESQLVDLNNRVVHLEHDAAATERHLALLLALMARVKDHAADALSDRVAHVIHEVQGRLEDRIAKARQDASEALAGNSDKLPSSEEDGGKEHAREGECEEGRGKEHIREEELDDGVVVLQGPTVCGTAGAPRKEVFSAEMRSET